MTKHRAILWAKLVSTVGLVISCPLLDASGQTLPPEHPGINLDAGERILRPLAGAHSAAVQGSVTGFGGSVSPPNPLWAITLESLAHTRERPLFSASRRLPAIVVPSHS